MNGFLKIVVLTVLFSAVREANKLGWITLADLESMPPEHQLALVLVIVVGGVVFFRAEE